MREQKINQQGVLTDEQHKESYRESRNRKDKKKGRLTTTWTEFSNAHDPRQQLHEINGRLAKKMQATLKKCTRHSIDNTSPTMKKTGNK